jgi:hypothetical protein
MATETLSIVETNEADTARPTRDPPSTPCVQHGKPLWRPFSRSAATVDPVRAAPKAQAKLKDDRQGYIDKDITRRYRRESARINAWLESADIERSASEEADLDIYDWRLRRIFNGSFDRGGGLLGGLWMNNEEALSRRPVHRR